MTPAAPPVAAAGTHQWRPRIAWVSERARAVWAPRLVRIVTAWQDVQWLSVYRGQRSCGLVRSDLERYLPLARTWSAHAMSSILLTQPDAGWAAAAWASGRGRADVAVGALPDVLALQGAWAVEDVDAIGIGLGYPRCCVDAFASQARQIGETGSSFGPAEIGGVDVTTAGPSRVLSGRATLTNVLWADLGVRAILHMPCSWECAESRALAESLLDVARRSGFSLEATWLQQILSWPVEWSALHGIAELKTPILRVSAPAPATRRKVTVRLEGDEYPAEGADGVRFPYRERVRSSSQPRPIAIRGLDGPRM